MPSASSPAASLRRWPVPLGQMVPISSSQQVTWGRLQWGWGWVVLALFCVDFPMILFSIYDQYGRWLTGFCWKDVDSASVEGFSGSTYRWQHYTQSAVCVRVCVSHPSHRRCSTAHTLHVTLLIPEGKFVFSPQKEVGTGCSFLLKVPLASSRGPRPARLPVDGGGGGWCGCSRYQDGFCTWLPVVIG